MSPADQKCMWRMCSGTSSCSDSHHTCCSGLSPPSGAEREGRGQHPATFDADVVRSRCMPWLLDPFPFLRGCSLSRRDAVCSAFAAFVFLVGASVADNAVPVGSCVLASGLVCRSLSALALPPVFRVAGCCPLPSRSAPLGGLRPKPHWGKVWSPISFFLGRFLRLCFCSSHRTIVSYPVTLGITSQTYSTVLTCRGLRQLCS
jgi:hypothetical protein